ncbi:hypothetical protein U0070_026230, partial [Myodes glareolus]
VLCDPPDPCSLAALQKTGKNTFIVRWCEHEQNEREVHLPEIFAKCIRFSLMEDKFIEKIPPQFAQAILQEFHNDVEHKGKIYVLQGEFFLFYEPQKDYWGFLTPMTVPRVQGLASVNKDSIYYIAGTFGNQRNKLHLFVQATQGTVEEHIFRTRRKNSLYQSDDIADQWMKSMRPLIDCGALAAILSVPQLNSVLSVFRKDKQQCPAASSCTIQIHETGQRLDPAQANLPPE